MPPQRRTPSPWQQRLNALQSISLRSIADELNARRLRAVNDRLAGKLSETDRKRMARLCRLVERHGWPLEVLPSDMRADGERMKLALLAFHRVLGGQHWFPVKEADLAVKMAAELCSRSRSEKPDPRTARRAIADLRDAALIGVQERKRPAYLGGQAENGFLIVWATIRELAECQGVQLTLFDDDAMSLERGSGVVDGGTATVAGTPGHSGNPPGHSGNPPGHSGNPPGHGGKTLGHRGHPAPELPISAHACGGATSLSSMTSESSSSFPDRREGKRRILESPDWQQVVTRLDAYDVKASLVACTDALGRGWTAAQALAFVQDCERRAIDGVRAYKPGQLFWQLVNGPPGSRISTPASEAYRRAERDRNLQNARKATARDDVAADQARQQAIAELERRHGAELDAMSGPALQQLARELRLQSRYERVGLAHGMRAIFLQELSKRCRSPHR